MRSLPRTIITTTAVTGALTMGVVGATVTPSGASSTAAVAAAPTPAAAVTGASQEGRPLTPAQRAHLEQRSPAALAAIESAIAEHGQPAGGAQAEAFPIAAVAIGAAAWCARGALASIPTSALADVANGAEPTSYVENAIVGCLAGEIGGVVWRFVPGWAKKQAVAMVASFVIRYTRS